MSEDGVQDVQRKLSELAEDCQTVGADKLVYFVANSEGGTNWGYIGCGWEQVAAAALALTKMAQDMLDETETTRPELSVEKKEMMN